MFPSSGKWRTRHLFSPLVGRNRIIVESLLLCGIHFLVSLRKQPQQKSVLFAVLACVFLINDDSLGVLPGAQAKPQPQRNQNFRRSKSDRVILNL